MLKYILKKQIIINEKSLLVPEIEDLEDLSFGESENNDPAEFRECNSR